MEKENIKTKKKEERRNRDLEKIFKLDRKLEQMAITKQQTEFESLYPHRENSEGTCVPADIFNKSSSDTSHGISDNTNRKVSKGAFKSVTHSTNLVPRKF